MASQRIGLLAGLTALIALASSTPVPVAGQTGTATLRTVPPPSMPTARHTPWGDPDLQGIWTAGYLITPLERPDKFAAKEFLTDEEVVALEKEAALTFGVGAGAGKTPRPPRGTEAD